MSKIKNVIGIIATFLFLLGFTNIVYSDGHKKIDSIQEQQICKKYPDICITRNGYIETGTLVEVTEDKPVNVVCEAPKLTEVDPMVTAEFVKALFAALSELNINTKESCIS